MPEGRLLTPHCFIWLFTTFTHHSLCILLASITNPYLLFFFFFFNDPPPPELSPLPLHDPLPIYPRHLLAPQSAEDQHIVEPVQKFRPEGAPHRIHDLAAGMPDRLGLGEALFEIGDRRIGQFAGARSEEHTSELQSPCNLVCRLLL